MNQTKPKTYLASDIHFGHDNLYGFAKDVHDIHPLKKVATPGIKNITSGEVRVRGWADNAEEGDEIIIERWNSVIDPHDKVFVLGDIVMNKKHIDKVARLNGIKTLILGNHDHLHHNIYDKYFKAIRGMRGFPIYHKGVNIGRGVMQHAPIHECEMDFCILCIHGHLHECVIRDDERYISACLEPYDAYPQLMDDLIAKHLPRAMEIRRDKGMNFDSDKKYWAIEEGKEDIT